MNNMASSCIRAIRLVSKFKQDRQCMYSATLWSSRKTNVAVVKQRVLHSLCVCVCSLRYSPYKAHDPYCHLFFLKRFTTQTVYTRCTKINYKIVSVTNLTKYVIYGTSKNE